MMKRLGLLFVLVMLMSACTLIPGAGNSASREETITDCSSVVDGMTALQSNLEIPEYFLTDNPVKQGGEFDVMQYFTVLNRLSMQPGYKLDYYYDYDEMGGYPSLYVYPAEQSPSASAPDFQAAGYKKKYLDYLQVEDSAEGYFQFILLALRSQQFYQYWHANYNDTQVICDQADVHDIIASLDGDFGNIMHPDSRQLAYQLEDLTPTVILSKQTAQVRMVNFTKWGGFFLNTYTISRSSPHTITDVQQENLIPYDCGVLF